MNADAFFAKNAGCSIKTQGVSNGHVLVGRHDAQYYALRCDLPFVFSLLSFDMPYLHSYAPAGGDHLPARHFGLPHAEGLLS